MTSSNESDIEREIRLGLRPYIMTNTMIKNSTKRRTWVNSEKMPWFPHDRYRVLVNQDIMEWKKSWWVFGKWIKLYSKFDFDEICVWDGAVIR